MKNATFLPRSRRLAWLILAAALVAGGAGATGCAIGPRIVTEYDSNSFAGNPRHERVTWTYLWGLVQPKDVDPGCDAGFNHLNRVDVKTNIGYILISAITLGAVVPTRIAWDCAPPPVTPGDLGKDR